MISSLIKLTMTFLIAFFIAIPMSFAAAKTSKRKPAKKEQQHQAMRYKKYPKTLRKKMTPGHRAAVEYMKATRKSKSKPKLTENKKVAKKRQLASQVKPKKALAASVKKPKKLKK